MESVWEYFVIFSMCLFITSGTTPLRITVVEEKDVGYLVGNILALVKNSLKPEFALKNQPGSVTRRNQDDYFRLSNDGNLTVQSRLDRDVICKTSKSSSPQDCVLPIKVMLWPKPTDPNSSPTPLDIEIILADLNDNPPTFQKQQNMVEVIESAKVGTIAIRLPKAEDLDEGQNGRILYYLEGPDKGYFSLQEEENYNAK